LKKIDCKAGKIERLGGENESAAAVMSLVPCPHNSFIFSPARPAHRQTLRLAGF